MKLLLSDRATKAIAQRITAPSPATSKPIKAAKPPKVEAAEQTARVDISRQLFDAAWYTTFYPEAPQDPDEAYRFYLETGMRDGHHPNSAFENLRYPDRAHVPQGHLYRVTASPLLCRVPPTRYLAPYQIKIRLHKLYNTFDDYRRRAMIMPDTIGPELWESDLRVVAYMDNSKRKLASDYAALSQDTLISVIMTTHDCTAAIADAVVSVLLQSYENWELVVVDDASANPDTESAIRQFGDSRIKYVPVATPVGVGGARNLGVEHASGTIIAYLDDTAQWDPDFLLILFNQLRSQSARIAYGAHVLWDSFDADARLGRAFKGIRFAPFSRPRLENRDDIAPVALLHDRELLREIGGFDPSLTHHVGWDIILRMTEIAQPLAIPCLLGHSFQGKAGSEHVTDEASISALKLVHAKLVQRSEWSQAFTTTDGRDQLAFSLSRSARARRQPKLNQLPVEPVQIVIPNYESASELEMCLRSIAEQTSVPYQVLIVDNGSSEETYARLEDLPGLFENVRLIKEDRNSGFSFAVNRGLAEVMDGDDKILILNNDTLATPGWLDELRYVLFKHDDVGMAVPRQVLPAGNRITRVHVPGAVDAFECDINLSIHHNNILDLEFDREDGLIELTYAPLFCGLLRPETIRAAGGLDSGNAPHYRSDWILCDFIRRHLQQRIVYTPHSKVYHLQGVATERRKSSDESFLGQSVNVQSASRSSQRRIEAAGE
ncbi:glycosyltransferase family 2 protein [Microvirga splendida]|uniref:Glycosyltransferase family 2 protein n=1 Tax=Microvirga splendida TaxID=2795727 RepID=A0ABS0Y1Y5_9HYPH|nr:glycosyltransferase family 2 protein [Microvirga splendida]MBJ6126309.1 glycosyltransferase family 2 protein [Microvirga splendida]